MGAKLLLTSSVAALATMATLAHSGTVVTAGSATLTFTEDLNTLGLTISSSSWSTNADGNFERDFVIRPSEGLEYDYVYSDGSVRTFTASANSQSYTTDASGNAYLRLAGGSAYIDATDAAGEVIETFATVYILPQRGDDADLFSEALRDINFVATADPLVWEDFENPGTTYTFTAEEAAYLSTGELRLCCTHSLNDLAIDTAAMAIDGLIDDVAERDINFDGVIDDQDDFYLFDLVASGVDGIYDMALTETMASFLNFGFSEFGFADPTEFLAEWGNADGFLDFAAGDVIGTASFSYDVAAVPVPAALPLLAGGLGVMGFVGRRKKRRLQA